MNLRDGVLAVRLKIGELQPQFWSDDEIVDALNESAKRMTQAAQSFTDFATFTTAQVRMPDGTLDWAQEYELPENVDTITGAAYFSGVVFNMKPTKRDNIQIGGKVGGLPWYFYVKKNTRTMTPQIDSAQITNYNINPNSVGSSGRMVIGLYSIPQQALPIYIWYIGWHPTLKNPFDEVQIPDRFKQGWIAFAVARCKEKESALDEAQYYDNIHASETQEFILYMCENGQAIQPPQYGDNASSTFLRGASSVIVVAQSPGVTNL